MTDLRYATFLLSIDGADASTELSDAIEELAVECSLHLPDALTLTIYDPNLTWTDGATFGLGKALKVSFTGTNSVRLPQTGVVFDGEIVEVELGLDGEEYRLTVRAFDRRHRLARGTKSQVFVNVTDSDMVKKIAAECGLQSSVDATSEVWPYVLRAGESALTFLQRRAAANGYLLYVDEKTLCFKKPAADGAAIDLNGGENLLRFRSRLSTLGQVDRVTVRGWDMKAKQEVVGQANKAALQPTIGERPRAPNTWFNLEAALELRDVTLGTVSAAEKLANAELLRHASRHIEAEGEALGNPALLAGVSVMIGNMGTRFGGQYFVTSATHRYTPEEGYRVQFSVSGVNPATLLASLLPEGAAPPLHGLVPALVTAINDPQKWGRVKVKLPWLGDTIESDWTRVLSVGAGRQRGIQWLPEINDEVLVGFADGDFTTPFVLGGLWNGKDSPPMAPATFCDGSGNLTKRKLVSRAGHEITFDDADDTGGILIKDKDGNQIEIKAKDKLITVTSLGDIKFVAEKGITLEAKGEITIDTKAAFGVKAATDVKLEASAAAIFKGGSAGATVDGTGQVTIKAVNAKVEGSAVVEVKGAIVKLN